MKRLLCALAFVTIAACGDDAAELGDVDAATAARDELCFGIASGMGSEWFASVQWHDAQGKLLRVGAQSEARIDTEREACALACEWEEEHCGGARPDCGAHPEIDDGRCSDG